jgi:hypothetical protein
MKIQIFDIPQFFPAATLCAALAAFPASASAQLLLTTTDTGTQGAGGNQLEVAYTQDRTRTGKGEEKETERVRALDVAYTYGLTETLDIYAGVSHVRWRLKGFDEDGERFKEHASGFSNTVIGAKWRFFDNEASGTSLAIVPEIALPVSSQREEDGLGVGRTSGSLTLALSQSLPFGSLNFNAGIGRERFRHEDSATIRSFSVAPIWEISERWKLEFDTGIDLIRSGGNTERSKFAEIAVAYAPIKDIEVSIAFTRTTNDERPRSKSNAVAAGLTWWF